MRSILGKTQFGKPPGGRPPLAVELAPQGVLAAAQSGSPLAYAYEPLPENAIVPGIAEANLRAPEAVSAAIRKTLGQLAPHGHAVTLILPDTAVRVFVLDFDSLPGRAADAIAILRFRLRKMVSFDVERAGISYQILTESKTQCKALAAVLPGTVLEEYEAAVRAAGYEPGVVLSSGLAALATIDTPEAVLTANLTGQALTTAIAQGHDLLLYRTLVLPEETGQRRLEVQRDIAVAAAFYEDKLGSRPRQLRYAGLAAEPREAAAEFARLLDDPELTVADLVPRPETGATTALGNLSLAGVTGALTGVA